MKKKSASWGLPIERSVAYAQQRVQLGRPIGSFQAVKHLCEIGSFIVRTATEVQGGIGFTDEHDLHLWFERVGVGRVGLSIEATLRAVADERRAARATAAPCSPARCSGRGRD